jgi:hypothetical protein
MSDPIPLFELNPAVDRAAAARRFADEGRVQVRDFLTVAAAQTIHRILSRETPWGLAWRAGEDGPHGLRRQQLADMRSSMPISANGASRRRSTCCSSTSIRNLCSISSARSPACRS